MKETTIVKAEIFGQMVEITKTVYALAKTPTYTLKIDDQWLATDTLGAFVKPDNLYVDEFIEQFYQCTAERVYNYTKNGMLKESWDEKHNLLVLLEFIAQGNIFEATKDVKIYPY